MWKENHKYIMFSFVDVRRKAIMKMRRLKTLVSLLL